MLQQIENEIRQAARTITDGAPDDRATRIENNLRDATNPEKHPGVEIYIPKNLESVIAFAQKLSSNTLYGYLEAASAVSQHCYTEFWNELQSKYHDAPPAPPLSPEAKENAPRIYSDGHEVEIMPEEKTTLDDLLEAMTAQNAAHFSYIALQAKPLALSEGDLDLIGNALLATAPGMERKPPTEITIPPRRPPIRTIEL